MQPYPGQPYPGQQYPGQPYPGQPYPGLPYPDGPQTPAGSSKRGFGRGPLIAAGAGVLLVVLFAVVVIVVVRTSSSSPAAQGSASAPASASAPDTSTYRVVPASALPTADQVQQITLLNVRASGSTNSSVDTDSQTTPASCALTYDPATQSSWGSSISTAGQSFLDGTADDFSNGVWTALAVFSTADAAQASLTTVTASVDGCKSYTTPLTTGSGTAIWAVSDEVKGDGRLTWLGTRTNLDQAWRCGLSYRVVANIAAYAYVCGANPADSPAKLTDTLIANATRN